MGAYQVYFGKQLMPVAPERLELKIKNKNTTMVLADGSEINLLKKPGLTDISLELRLPIDKYPWSNYGGATDQVRFLNMFEEYKSKKIVFEFTVLRNMSDYKSHKSALFSTNLKVTIEEYTIKEDAEYGGDVMVEFQLKQFKPYYKTAVVSGLASPRPDVFYSGTSADVNANLSIQTLKGDTLKIIVNRYYTSASIAGNKAAKAVLNANPSLRYYSIYLSGATIYGLDRELPGGVKLTLPIV